MLRVPVLELLGIDLEPLLVMRVDIDAAAGKVRGTYAAPPIMQPSFKLHAGV